ncbi:VWFA and cache domain-containing protein 1 [Neocloeon triangulifer]|uniref:VWFA and cache domain-containing protein 1 n=1 Tax=Neocloeon triangulifer TaxID=2078957 RepID=UPI00286F15E2|nr:VWFA and cache domain-containing protein 1 [Neocloeon triangulifer]
MWVCGLFVGLLLMAPAHSFGNSSIKLIRAEMKRPWNNEVVVEPIRGVYLEDLAGKIGSNLRQISNQEMGVTVMQEIYDALQFGPTSRDDTNKVVEMAERLQMKVRRYMAVLNRSKATIEEMFWRHTSKLSSTSFPCCTPEPDAGAGQGSRSFSCLIGGSADQLGLVDHGSNLTDVFSANIKSHPTIKSQFFVSSADLKGRSFTRVLDQSAPCVQDTRHRDVFFDTIEAHSKKVLILIDHGNSLSQNQLSLAKILSKRIISTLAPTDQVGVMALADGITLPSNLKCLSSSLPLAIQHVKTLFSRFVDSLEKSKTSTNHSLGFQSALQTIRKVANVEDTVLLVYISRGLLSSLEEAKVVFETIANNAQIMPSKVVLSTAALVDDGKPLMIEKQFMQDLAAQNYHNYNLTAPRRVIPGLLQIVNSSTSISLAVSQLFNSMKDSVKHEPSFSLPTWDGQGLVVSITQPCLHLNEVVGVVGLDLQLSDLVEDVTYFNGYGSSYAFIITKNGLVLMHPSLPRPSFAFDQPLVVDIDNFETIPDFQVVRRKMLSHKNGSFTVILRKNSRNYDKEQVHYCWRQLDEAPYILVIASHDKGKPLRTLQRVAIPSSRPSLVYHRLDLLPTPPKVNICRHQRQLATLDSGSIFLSAACFQSPFEYLIHEDIPMQLAKSYMDFLFNKQGANPGLKSSVKNDVGALMQIIDHWKNEMQESTVGKYIVRSFAATPSGVFQMYPGSGLDHDYDPTRRPWYIRALKFPGKVVLSTPYLDVGGAGYIVTLSHTVYEGQSAALHSPSDTVAAVLGLDVTVGFVYKLLIQAAPFCQEPGVKCLLIDDEGYVLAHPSLIDGRGIRQHLTHKEPLVANDMLNHQGLASKVLCSSFADQTLQRYFRFNTSLSTVLTNLVHGEQCAKYQIAAVPGTNVFVVVVNATCDVVTTFCPCSVTDRLCLNCNRMEQTDCECPCECPLEIDYCTGELANKDEHIPSCPPVLEALKPAQHSAIVPEESTLEPCFPRDCEYINAYSDCLGVVGCEWCVLDSDEETPLRSPFCTFQEKCFNGILGSRTPYSNTILGGQLSEASSKYKTTPIGPVAGGFIGIILTVGMAIYCYKMASQRQHIHAYMSSVPETAVRMSTLDNEVDDEDSPSQTDTNAQQQQQQILLEELPSAISPYRVSTNYRRPPGGDSDHGYSTMTPHDDSEHTPCAEPLLLAKPVRTSSNSSSPVTTELPMNQFLAPVTVHMVDTL